MDVAIFDWFVTHEWKVHDAPSRREVMYGEPST